jgi:hypothetical protein
MHYYGIIGALVAALLISLVFSLAFNNRGPWGIFWTFFLVIFLAALAGQLWIKPIGPVYWGIAWVPLFAVGLLFAFLLAASVAVSAPKELRKEGEEVKRGEATVAAAVGAFFWLMVIILVLAIAVGYYRMPVVIDKDLAQ